MASTSTATGPQLRSTVSLAGVSTPVTKPEEVIVPIDTSPATPSKGLR
jgi:hypothetical protein